MKKKTDLMGIVIRVVLYSIVISLIAIIACSNMRTSKEVSPNLPVFKHVDKSKAKYEAIVRLKYLDGRFFCTGFVIDDKYVVTAAHCLSDFNGALLKQEIEISNDLDEELYLNAKPAALDNRNDLGLVVGDFSNFKHLEIDSINAGLLSFSTFSSCGYPYGQKDLLCTRLYPKTNYYFQIYGSGFLYPGMSGGPVFDSIRNVVVGVNSAVVQNGVIVSPLIGILENFGIDK